MKKSLTEESVGDIATKRRQANNDFAKIYPGGSIEFEQKLVDGKRWAYSYLDEDLTIREAMLHTVRDKTRMTAWNFELLPAPTSFQDAVRTLLAMPVPLQ